MDVSVTSILAQKLGTPPTYNLRNWTSWKSFCFVSCSSKRSSKVYAIKATSWYVLLLNFFLSLFDINGKLWTSRLLTQWTHYHTLCNQRKCSRTNCHHQSGFKCLHFLHHKSWCQHQSFQKSMFTVPPWYFPSLSFFSVVFNFHWSDHLEWKAAINGAWRRMERCAGRSSRHTW